MNDRKFCIYKHTCPNGKVYIGITSKDANKRWRNGHGYAKQTHFYRAIVKYGWENINHEVLYSNLTKDMACQLEIYLIAMYKSNNPNYGYNKSIGGEATSKGCVFSEEQRKRISEAMSGKNNPMYGRCGELNPMYGKTHTQEARDKISKALKGKYIGEKSGMYGKHLKQESKYWLGKHLSQDTKDKLSSAHDKDKKPVEQYDAKTGEFIALYNSVMEASRQTGCNDSAIVRVCKGKQHTSCGYVWKYFKQDK